MSYVNVMSYAMSYAKVKRQGRLIALCSAMLLVPALVVRAQNANDDNPIDYKAATPEEAVKFLEKCYKTGNLKGFIAALAMTPAAAAQGVLDACEEIKSLSEVMNEKFGKPLPNVENFDQKRRMMLTQSLTVTETPKVNNDRATLMVRKIFLGSKDSKKRTRDQVYSAVREDGNWKLIPPEYDEQGIQKMETFAHMKDVAVKIKEGVSSGKIETHGEAVLRFLEAMEKFDAKPAGQTKPE